MLPNRGWGRFEILLYRLEALYQPIWIYPPDSTPALSQ
jgi:hypothetical protein